MFNFINAPYLNLYAENNTNAFAFFSIGLLVVFPLITLVRCSYQGNREKVVEMLVLALIFAVLSIITIYVRQSMISILRHLKSIFQTYALLLLVYALYIYYRGSICHKDNIIHPDIHPDIQKIELERIYPGFSGGNVSNINIAGNTGNNVKLNNSFLPPNNISTLSSGYPFF
jgi:hypothetical protein